MPGLLHNTFTSLSSWIFYKDTSLHVHKVSPSLTVVKECSGMLRGIFPAAQDLGLRLII